MCYLLYVLVYVRCTKRFQYYMTLVSFNNNTTGATSEAGTLYHSGTSDLMADFFVGFMGLNI